MGMEEGRAIFAHAFADWNGLGFQNVHVIEQGSDSDINLVLFDRFTFCTRPRSDRTATSIRFC